MQNLILELVRYGIEQGLVEEEDLTYTVNRLLEVFALDEIGPVPVDASSDLPRPLQAILDDLVDKALSAGLLEDSTESRDLFDTKIMGCLTPAPSVVRQRFSEKYQIRPEEATDWFYAFSKAVNYIRIDRIARDVKWEAPCEYGMLDITINLSKPEKDPRDIAKAGKRKSSGYPACLLCKENEGYAGHFGHPARQNHRLIPLMLAGEPYYLQYSPYVYYNEHCIVLHRDHIPMKIDQTVFNKLLDFVTQFPHYTIGSNADLPIVGGSILSHDHFQGGRYEFPMARAAFQEEFLLDGFPGVQAGIVKWPLSVIRISGEVPAELTACAGHILDAWRGYSDPEVGVYAETEGVPHNTVTPIARKLPDGRFQLDLVLRNNITTSEHPLGVFHPHAEYHHIKKENIGLIEVMGLAVLPARLKREMELCAKVLLSAGKGAVRTEEEAVCIAEGAACGLKRPAGLPDLPEEIAHHGPWLEEILARCNAQGRTFSEGNVDRILQEEIGTVFAKVLDCAGVFKWDEAGRNAFHRFVESLGKR